MTDQSLQSTVTVERDGRVLLIGLNRPAQRNAFTKQLINELSAAYTLLESDADLWVGVLFAHGEHFTSGFDLVDVGPDLATGKLELPNGHRDPWRLDGYWTKPIVAAAQGWVMTLGIELLLAADIRVASRDARFRQLEVRRGMHPFGGATIRFPQLSGWGNAMRWILTGDEFDATEAHRIGLIQEIAPDRHGAIDRAREIAATLAERCAPLGVQATLSSAHTARTEGEQAAIARRHTEVARLLSTADGVEGIQSFVERRAAVFTGR
ncbi:crotonase/enoyl-CoA hydratase family protein [Gordonia sp. HY285]|uniref:crotonase/enoyl-CoA hydratase family protein n=1 Tax=Gordonia liuliyuniae TaxID=2911517 RepID=UPI001F193567|nr:crotonase/enoyl-CoA hydratase family protein [Gordonia liuliyuniae]MCF8608926.1 crotonase/enoyl-CoA hydratase family protein [Gordonia liuliyuniae]